MENDEELKAPYTERFAQCRERKAVSHRLLLDFTSLFVLVIRDLLKKLNNYYMMLSFSSLTLLYR